MNRTPPSRARRKRLWPLAVLAAAALACGCRTAGYYAQAARGQYQILARQKGVNGLIADPQTPAALRTQLRLVQELRAFAARELRLPVDGHYRNYADLQRPYVVWNVQAAAAFSLEPKTWWYPLVGRLEYRGYFSERGAADYARRLEAKGCDVSVEGVEAYSTLGWFRDPVLNTFVSHAEPDLAEIIFHELAHQRVFAPGDTDFNEAFATAAGQEGARRWLRAAGNTNLCETYVRSLRRNGQFVQLIMNARAQLEKIYGDTRDPDGKIKAAKKPPAAPDQLQREKQRVLDGLRAEYEQLKAGWDGYAGFDGWFTSQLNNARLNSVANYYDLVPGFERLLEANGGELEAFYRATERLAKMRPEQRRQCLSDLANGSGRAP
jgi:predicted aminopeptidase